MWRIFMPASAQLPRRCRQLFDLDALLGALVAEAPPWVRCWPIYIALCRFDGLHVHVREHPPHSSAVVWCAFVCDVKA